MRIFLFSLLLLGCGLIAPAQTPDAARLDAYFQALEKNNKFMGSVSVFRNGVEIYTKPVGFADADKRLPARKDTKYGIGSVSKTFTAVLVFQAIEAGKLSLTETIDSYFPSIKGAEKITIAQLLGHRSGIHNFTDDKKYPDWQTRDLTREQMVGIIARGGSDFEPDSRAQYSNSNYVLLSYILESVYGKPYGKILADGITGPLALDNTYLGSETVRPDRGESRSYRYTGTSWKVERKTHPSIASGAGGIVSTPADLNKFAVALWDGRLIAADHLSRMQTLKDNFGMGLFAFPFHTEHGYGHGGNIDGFQAFWIYFPKDKIAYAITSNGLNYPFNDIHIAVLSWVYGLPFDIPDFQVVRLAPEILDRYTGVYACSQLPVKLTIRRNGDSLEGQGTGQPAFPLEAVGERQFQFTQGGIGIEFVPADSILILKQGGGVFHFKKE